MPKEFTEKPEYNFAPLQSITLIIPNFIEKLGQHSITSIWDSPQEAELNDITGVAYDIAKFIFTAEENDVDKVLTELNGYTYSFSNYTLSFFDEFFETLAYNLKLKDEDKYNDIIIRISNYPNLNLYLKPWLALQ